eukprot:CAMPEP_0179023420 /NCGR_PEP_ID=MMETSP0796-20121207/6920_1 /TAXON_ID=73915 /ORGANISM="Pyrodinium bahamense, Strain pbaha01" /LENGTH=848 /DNA_ID=CAMNT_0020719329 /DNA_START=15 /DNA_END=2557 /DNA_ORIENTATION=+
MAGLGAMPPNPNMARLAPLVMGKRLRGIIKSLNENMGVGFIACPETEHVFQRDVSLHLRDVVGPAAIGSHVTFYVELNGEGEPEARNVVVESTESWDGSGGRQAQFRGGPAEMRKGKASKAYYLGFIKSFSARSGFGFIACSEARARFGSDVFLHRDELQGFAVGDIVHFRIAPDAQHGTPRACELSAPPEGMAGAWAGMADPAAAQAAQQGPSEQELLEQRQEEEQLSQLQLQIGEVLRQAAEREEAERQAAAQREALAQQQQAELHQRLLQQRQQRQEEPQEAQQQELHQRLLLQLQQRRQQEEQQQQEVQQEQLLQPSLALLQQQQVVLQQMSTALQRQSEATYAAQLELQLQEQPQLQAYAAQLELQMQENPHLAAAQEAAQLAAQAEAGQQPLPHNAPPDFDFGKTYVGVIRSFNDAKGFGFISCDEVREALGCDVFLHSSQRQNNEDVGDVVSFNIQPSRMGQPRARNIQAIGSVQDPDMDVDPTKVFKGYVKSYNPEKGFGFIACSETFAIYNADIFLHKHHAEGINVGDAVQFTIKMNLKGQPQARNLVKVAEAWPGAGLMAAPAGGMPMGQMGGGSMGAGGPPMGTGGPPMGAGGPPMGGGPMAAAFGPMAALARATGGAGGPMAVGDFSEAAGSPASADAMAMSMPPVGQMGTQRPSSKAMAAPPGGGSWEGEEASGWGDSGAKSWEDEPKVWGTGADADAMAGSSGDGAKGWGNGVKGAWVDGANATMVGCSGDGAKGWSPGAKGWTDGANANMVGGPGDGGKGWGAGPKGWTDPANANMASGWGDGGKGWGSGGANGWAEGSGGWGDGGASGGGGGGGGGTGGWVDGSEGSWGDSS